MSHCFGSEGFTRSDSLLIGKQKILLQRVQKRSGYSQYFSAPLR